ncbi:MAG: hypothetical protein JF606_07815 [Burkholderiales bacterium]|nr:hypothetical protein [Burkholderiales bacterium]
MKFSIWRQATAASTALALLAASASTNAASGPTPEEWRDARAAAAGLADELAHLCPVAAPGSQSEFESCRKGLYNNSAFRDKLNPIVLWGRQRNANATLAATSLTQFAPDVLTGMYLPLFMFNGKHTIAYIEGEGLFQIRLATAFRNRLAPGQFPYPFWHDAEKWATYQGANEVILWWDPAPGRVKVAQFTAMGAQPPIAISEPVAAPKFDGQWMWSDAQGKSQPKVTLFDGLFSSDNPYLVKLETSYKVLALRLREGQCDSCHVPNNPDKSKRLVLLQTPVHAAGEIQRLLKAVRDDRMPRDEFGIESPLDAKTKKALLEDGEAFAKVVDAAKRWEAQAREPTLANSQ